MKVLLLAALAIMFSTACQACNLSDNDFKAVAASPSHLTPSAVSALPLADQESLCKTRACIKLVDDQKGVINDFCPFSLKYLTQAEKGRIDAAYGVLLERRLKAQMKN